jgi:ribonuclease HII
VAPARRRRAYADFELESEFHRQGLVHVAGVDEVGRGPLAGPVVAAAVILPADCEPLPLADSKLLEDAERRALAPVILRHCLGVGIGMADAAEIDRINILQASFLAMRRALARVNADAIIVDGRHTIPDCDLPQEARIGGDRKSASVAAASIIAKVVRDDFMAALDLRHPGYGFDRHKGYATPEHFDALDLKGPCAEHRQTFLVRWRERAAQQELALATR